MTTTYTREEILEHRKQWVAALRSGTIPQLLQRLGNESGARCCLGVVEDLAGVSSDVSDAGFLIYIDKSGEGDSEQLTPEGAAWLGVRNLDPMVGHLHLSVWNDIEHKNFSEIADLYELHGFNAHDDLLVECDG